MMEAMCPVCEGVVRKVGSVGVTEEFRVLGRFVCEDCEFDAVLDIESVQDAQALHGPEQAKTLLERTLAVAYSKWLEGRINSGAAPLVLLGEQGVDEEE
jgi:hypothetical protein